MTRVARTGPGKDLRVPFNIMESAITFTAKVTPTLTPTDVNSQTKHPKLKVPDSLVDICPSRPRLLEPLQIGRENGNACDNSDKLP